MRTCDEEMPKRFYGGCMEQAKELRSDIARHRAALIGLQLDRDVTSARMERCAKAVDDLEPRSSRF